MVRILIVDNPLTPDSWTEHQAADPRDFLMGHFGSWPPAARIYDLDGVDNLTRAAEMSNTVALTSRDVTPVDEAGIERLGRLPGPLVVSIGPANPGNIVTFLVSGLLGLAISFLMPKVPEVNNTFASPNNSLSNRTNQARPGARIPDIAGTVRCTPDMLSVPYRTYENHQEIEISLMCASRGSIDPADIRDGDTLISSISGATVVIYGPGTSPNGGTPQLTIGTPIDDPVLSVVRLNDVNGQVLRSPNSNAVRGDNSIRFVYPDTIETNDSDIDFTELFEADDIMTVSNAAFAGALPGTTSVTESALFNLAGEIEFDTYDPTAVFAAGEFITITNGQFAGPAAAGGGAVVYVDLTGTYEIDSVSSTKVVLVDPDLSNPDWLLLDDLTSDQTTYSTRTFTKPADTLGIDLAGTYTVLSRTATTITLSNPNLVNSDWDDLDDLDGDATGYTSASLSTSGERWIGPFTIDLADLDRVYANIVAAQGLYRLTEKGKQRRLDVTVLMELTPVDSDDSPIGAAEEFELTVEGDAVSKAQRAGTLKAFPTFTGRCRIRMRRLTETDLDYDGTIVDEVKWTACYGLAPVGVTDFGNVTMVHARTYATSGATSVKERKLNMRATRMLPQRVSGSEFTEELFATDRVDDIIAAFSLDPYIGARTVDEIDFDNIYDQVARVEDYFGSERAVEFGYTFDDDQISFEETLATIAKCAFSTCYRQGSVIRLEPELATESSVLLFNHRNVLPGTQNRSVRFGVLDDHDGVELDWTAAKDGASLTYVIPYDRSATSPRKAEVLGVRSGELAFWHAQRAWNRMRYQNEAIEQQATQEAALVLPTNRVLITRLTAPPGYEGDVISQDGLTLTLSQPTEFEEGVQHTIFLQHYDATVEAISCEPADPADPFKVALLTAPSLDLSLGEQLSARPGYVIVPATDGRNLAYLITEREPRDNFTETVRAVNYSFLYYQHDELALWVQCRPAALYDAGPFAENMVPHGGATIVNDSARGLVYSGTGTGSYMSLPGVTALASYTKAAWVKMNAADASGNILAATSTGETFSIISGTLGAGHGSSQVTAPAPTPAEWHHVAVTYDVDGGELVLFVDGLVVDTATGIARGSLGELSAFRDLAGRLDDTRLWKRALSPVELRSVYLGSKTPS